MPLAPGTRLGSYEIVAPLGAGGMGEVYRARDTRLKRDVAIKIVPDGVAAAPDALSRFQVEAEAVAALSHPNILSIFDVGSEQGIPYAAMELLEGSTLRELLAPAMADLTSSAPPGMPPRKAIDYGRQIAAGLAAAHAGGITHRDLKPENVFVTRDGRVKLLDFGLAKTSTLVGAGSGSLQATVGSTTPGTVLGTVGYMAPEQVRGETADARSDIFAFGAILYEMLCGQRAFSGPSPVETMHAILRSDPPELTSQVRQADPTKNTAAVPPALDRIVMRCLEKNPDERFQSARDIGFALEAISGAGSTSAVHEAIADVKRSRRWLMPVVAAAGAAIVAFAAGAYLSPMRAPRPDFGTVTFETRSFETQNIFNARFTPDGSIVFSSANNGPAPQLFVNRPNSLAPQAIGGPGMHLLSVSSQGELAVLTNAEFLGHRMFRGTLARMPIDGAPRPWLTGVREADWSPDGSTLAIVRDDGRTDRIEYPIGKVLYTSSGNGYVSDIRVSPDGTTVAFFDHVLRYDDRGWLKIVDGAGQVRTLTGEYWGAEGIAWARDGKTIVFSAGDNGWDSFHPRAVAADGTSPAREALQGVGLFTMDIAPNGQWLVTENTDDRSIRALLPGDTTEREFAWLGSADTPDPSPDGKLLMFGDQSQSAGQNYAVSIRRTDGSSAIRLGEGSAIALSPDGTRALGETFTPPQIVVYPVGPGEAVRLKRGQLERVNPRAWLDSARVVVCGNEPEKAFRCYSQNLTGADPVPFTPDGFDVLAVAPDADAVAMAKQDQSVHLFSTVDQRTRPLPVSTTTDSVIGFSEDSRSLFLQPNGVLPARIERLDLSTGKRTLVREIAFGNTAGLMRLDVTRVLNDGAAYAYQYWRRTSRLFLVKGATAQ
jgi:eukaryotic-like serine/threonine-protein kinase